MIPDITDHEREQAEYWRNAAHRADVQGNPATALAFRNEAYFILSGKAIADNTSDAKLDKK
jgi:hypothetical protein